MKLSFDTLLEAECEPARPDAGCLGGVNCGCDATLAGRDCCRGGVSGSDVRVLTGRVKPVVERGASESVEPLCAGTELRAGDEPVLRGRNPSTDWRAIV
ncbi:hypothetical protein [Paraburkholderia sp.]|uniref:hypothetical protein n=1 Tax=Paraburkholderia sp. TaxID=1926495 RepID=UPI003D6E784D